MLIYSRMQIRFVNVATNILNIAIFSCSVAFVAVESYILNLKRLFLEYYVT